MFRDVAKLCKHFLYVQSTGSIAISRRRFPTLCNEPEATLLLSIMYQFNGSNMPTPQKAVYTKVEDTWDIILGRLVYYCLEEDKKFKQYYLSLPYEWQVIIHAILSKRILNTVGENVFLSNIEDLYNKDTIIARVTLPSLVDSAFTHQYIRKGSAKAITFPLTAYKVPKNVIYKNLRFFVNYGTKIITNAKSLTSKKEILNRFGHGRYGLIFVESKRKGYKYRTNVTPVFKGDVKDIVSIYKGEKTDMSKIYVFNNIVKYKECDSNENLTDLFTNNPKVNFLFVNNFGIHNITVQEDFVTLPCVDYLLDKDFTPKGVVAIYKEGTHLNIYFNVGRTDLIHGIEGRYIKCKIKTIFGVVISTSFNSVVPKWHTKYNCCKCCGEVTSKHKSHGICSSCDYKFRRNIITGNIAGIKSEGIDFDYIINIYEPTFSQFLVSRKDGFINYKCIYGQGILTLGE